MTERARHETILPFTRYLAGPADYTTMLFNDRKRDTTVAHQIATMVVFASPLLTIAANPQTMLDSPAVDVIRSVPSVWDETRVLAGSEIGELAMYARRSSQTWFLGVLCGPGAKTVRVPLSFLGASAYRATLVRDGADANAITVETATHRAGDTITLELRAGGGFIGRFGQ